MRGLGEAPVSNKNGGDWLERYYGEDEETWKAVGRPRMLWPSRRTARLRFHMNGLFDHLRAMSMR